MKVIALVITLALWLGVSGLSTPTVKRFTVPLVMSISNNAEITNTPIQEVDVVLSGDKRKIDQINRSDLTAAIDLTDVMPGDRVLQLTPDNVSVALPTGVRLEDIQPSRIAVKLELVDEKDIVVRAETTGQPADGFEIYSTTVNPAKVRVRGPASYVGSLDSVPTGAVDISGAKEDVSARQVPVSVPNAKASVFNTVVDVAIRIGETRVERSFLVSAAGGKSVSATLYGPRSLLAKLRVADLKADIVKDEAGEDVAQLLLPDALQGIVEIRKIRIN
jgi:YbbR domain-containing protein